MAISITITVSDGNEYKEVLEKYMPALGDLPESSVTLLLEATPRATRISSFFDDLERESMYRKEVEHAITHL